ncbi:MAG: glycosyltransferase [Selenomonadaceae bacterium]
MNTIYLGWRLLYTLPPELTISLVVGVVLLAAEGVGFFRDFVFKILFWQPYKLEEKQLFDEVERPSVDIFIATYNEPENLLNKTIAAAVNIIYPEELKNIYVCDDGHRDTVKNICREFGVHYLTRSNNEHAKAGNLNHALCNSQGELFAIFDADMIAKENFLTKTIPYFEDTQVAFVQTPQVFYNPDPFQYNLYFGESIPNEQDFFMKDIQQGRARFNAVLHVGTNAVFRRSAIEEIDGIPTGTITEDMATGMLLQAAGYKGIFLKEVLALGLSVEKFSDLIKQRERWCRGNIQVAKKWNPLTLRGLSFMQRLIYVDGLLFWFFGVQKMIYLICPLLYLLFGIMPIQADAQNLFFFFMPSYFAAVWSFRLLVSNNRSLMWSHIYDVAMAPYLAVASLFELIFARPIPFKVTPKGVVEDKVQISWNIVLPQLVLLIMTVAALSVGGYNIILGENVNLGAIAINTAWSVYNLLGIVMSILVCIERPRFRASERFMLSDEITINLSDVKKPLCRLEDISSEGLALVCKKEDIALIETQEEMDLIIHGLKEKTRGRVVWINQEHDKAGISFTQLDVGLYKELIRYLFRTYQGYYNKQQQQEELTDVARKIMDSVRKR